MEMGQVAGLRGASEWLERGDFPYRSFGLLITSTSEPPAPAGRGAASGCLASACSC